MVSWCKAWTQQTTQQNWEPRKKATHMCKLSSTMYHVYPACAGSWDTVTCRRMTSGRNIGKIWRLTTQAKVKLKWISDLTIRIKTKTFLKKTTAWLGLAMESCCYHKQQKRPSWTSFKIESSMSQRVWSREYKEQFQSGQNVHESYSRQKPSIRNREPGPTRRLSW